ncbi:hypothetical protein [uncultured Slackia sp.]|nr:hypothetical protein [uncultured Slackia sp.]
MSKLMPKSVLEFAPKAPPICHQGDTKATTMPDRNKKAGQKFPSDLLQ